MQTAVMAKVINGCNQLHFYDPGNSISRPPPSWVSSSSSGKDCPFFVLASPNMTSSLPVFHIDRHKFDFFVSSLRVFCTDQPKNDFFITWPLFRVTEAWKVIMWVVSPWRRVKRQFLISAPSYTTRHKTSWKARRTKNLREIVTSKSINLIAKYTESCNVCTIFL